MNKPILKVVVLSLIFVLCIQAIAFCNTIHVPKDYLKIQDAIDAASTGDTILVDQGTYVENIDYLGKDVTVKSEHGPEVTIIDANMQDSGVAFMYGETDKAVLDGFTVTNGTGHTHSASSRAGGGIYCLGAGPSLINNIIINNKSDLGGGIYYVDTSYRELEISNCYIAGNKAVIYGGGIYCAGGGSILNCTIKNNSCEGFGGGVRISVGLLTDKLLFQNNIVQDNIAMSKGAGKGGGIDVTGSGVLIENNIISGNIAGEGAGIKGSDAKIINNIICNNIAAHFGGFGNGGGILTFGYNTEITNNIIINNIALIVGGGIYWGVYSGKINNNIICYNKASGSPIPQCTMYGGGIAIDQPTAGETIISNCVIANNEADEYGGGICSYSGISKSKAILLNNTIYMNKAGKSGSGIYMNKEASFTIGNSIIYNNINDEIAYETSSPTVTYSNIKGGWPGTGNIDSDPLFVDPFNLDFHIKYNSPCRDAGDKTLGYLSPFDFENDPRIAYGEVDMGADEFYNHLYTTGIANHGARVDMKITGIPGTAPLWLFLSMSAKLIPQTTKWGDWYLEFPFLGPVMLGQIPAVDGIYVLPGIIPTTPAGQYDFHMQALIDTELSNCCTVEVK